MKHFPQDLAKWYGGLSEEDAAMAWKFGEYLAGGVEQHVKSSPETKQTISEIAGYSKIFVDELKKRQIYVYILLGISVVSIIFNLVQLSILL